MSLQPAIHEGVLAASASDGKLYILDARTGQDRVRFRTPTSGSAAPVMANEMAYLPAAGALYALDTSAREIPGLYQFKKIWAQGYLWQVPGVSVSGDPEWMARRESGCLAQRNPGQSRSALRSVQRYCSDY